MYVVTVEFEIRAENVDQFRAQMLLQAANSLANEEACRQFDVCFDSEDASKCFLYEKYDDRSAFDLHLSSDHFQQFDAEVSAWLVAKTVRTWRQATN